MNIRSATEGDHDALAYVYLVCRIRTFHWMPSEDFKIDDFGGDTKGEKIILAEVNSKVVGFISLWLEDNFIHHLFILPTFQDQGIGAKLINAAFSEIQRPVRLKCVAQNQKACKFYEKMGWKIESTTDHGLMGPYHTYVFE